MGDVYVVPDHETHTLAWETGMCDSRRVCVLAQAVGVQVPLADDKMAELLSRS